MSTTNRGTAPISARDQPWTSVEVTECVERRGQMSSPIGSSLGPPEASAVRELDPGLVERPTIGGHGESGVEDRAISRRLARSTLRRLPSGGRDVPRSPQYWVLVIAQTCSATA
jgi:hypothetical protein